MGKLQFASGNVLVLDMQVLSLNSLINPLIYGLIVKKVRTAVKENLFNLGHVFHWGKSITSLDLEVNVVVFSLTK